MTGTSEGDGRIAPDQLLQGGGVAEGFNWLSELLEMSPLALAPSVLPAAPAVHSPVELCSSPVFQLLGSANAFPTQYNS